MRFADESDVTRMGAIDAGSPKLNKCQSARVQLMDQNYINLRTNGSNIQLTIFFYGNLVFCLCSRLTNKKTT